MSKIKKTSTIDRKIFMINGNNARVEKTGNVVSKPILKRSLKEEDFDEVPSHEVGQWEQTWTTDPEDMLTEKKQPDERSKHLEVGK